MGRGRERVTQRGRESRGAWGLEHTLAIWSFPGCERGRTRDACRTKYTKMRDAMRCTRAPANDGVEGDAAGAKRERYSVLRNTREM